MILSKGSPERQVVFLFHRHHVDCKFMIGIFCSFIYLLTSQTHIKCPSDILLSINILIFKYTIATSFYGWNEWCDEENMYTSMYT